MAATVTLLEYNGSSGSETGTDKTSGTVRFKKTDNASADLIDPIPKPGSGLFERSMEKWLRMHIGGTGPSGSITSLRFYLSGSVATGMTLYVRTTNPTSYSTPAIPANDSAGTDASTYNSGSPKNMGDGPYTGTNTDFGNYFTLWAKAADTVSAPGTNGLGTLNAQYQET